MSAPAKPLAAVSPAPKLNPSDIQLELERIYSRGHRSYLVGLFGTGEAATVNVGGQQWQVIPTRCEMELRARLPLPGDSEHERRVFLVDWTERPLPLDLACRLASGRLFQISSESRLAALFGAREADPKLSGTGLATALLSGEIPQLKKVPGLALTRREAYRRFLDAHLDFPLTAELKASSILAWSLKYRDKASLLHPVAGGESWKLLRQEIRDLIRDQAGAFAELAWRAFEASEPGRFVELWALLSAHLEKKDPVAAGLLEGQVENLAPSFGADLFRSAEDWRGEPVLEELEMSLGEGFTALMRSADGLIPSPSLQPTREVSKWLPSAHKARECALADGFKALTKAPGSTTLDAVLQHFEALKKHRLDKVLRTEPQRETRQMAVRLGAYLVQRSAALPPSAAGLPFQAAIDLATDYAAEGGFVDWCRSRLRAPLRFEEQLNEAIHGMRSKVDELRSEDDRRFSRALIAWVEAGRPATDVTPIDRVTRQFAGELLDGTDRRLLIVLMDGMSWSAAVQILDRLEEEKWQPILWRPRGYQARPHFPPVLAEIPSLTQVSRAAFFAGRHDRRAGDKPTAEDRKRWASNRSLLKASGDHELPPLVMKAELMKGELLSPELLEAIESEAPVVGCVVNALDEDHRGSEQTLRDYRADVIKPLEGLLTAAAAANSERIVLLASDHGSVEGAGQEPHGQGLGSGGDSGKRWRSLAEHDELHPFEVELASSSWRPRGSRRVACIWDESTSHGRAASGEHGGASLAEVVTPMVLVAPEWLAHEWQDHSIATQPFPLPLWWEFERSEKQPPQPVQTAASKGPDSSVQLSLLPEPGQPAAEAAREQVGDDVPVLNRLERSKIFRHHVEGHDEQAVRKVLDQLGVLLEAGGSLSAQEFARRCGVRAHRVEGLVARMGLLNCDGYAIVEYDRAARQVTCHRQRLVQQFDLEPRESER